MRFRSTLLRVKKAVISLGGRWVRPKPLAHVTIIGPTGTSVEEGILDTGADDTVFPDSVARHIGIDLANAPQGEAAGVGSAPFPVRYAIVTLRMAQGSELREWQGWVGFTSVRMIRPLLGFAGIQQFFTATFHGDREEVELTVNSLYPGA